MAGSAGHVRVPIGQRETGGTVIENSRRPTDRVMASGTIGRRKHGARGGVRRIIGLVVLRHVAILASPRSQVVVVVDVAGSAGHVCVPIGQRKAGGAVIEDGGGPTRCVMASGAVRGGKSRTSRGVRRIIGLGVLRHVAILASARSQVVVVIDVARRARHVRVAVGQQEARRAVIKFRAQPAIKKMTPLAVARCERRPSARVGGIRRVLPVFQVAGIAGRREAQKHSRGGLLVAIVALHRRVCTQQRKAVLVIFHRLHRDIPALHCMALRAIWPHLPAVNIRVAIGAVLTHVRKHRLYVALNALHFLVHAPQGIFRLVVVKLGNRSDRAPAR